MYKRMYIKKSLFTLLLTLLALALPGRQSPAGASVTVDRVIAVVNGDIITMSDLQRETAKSAARIDERLLLEDMAITAIKIGMLGSVENVAAVAELVSDYSDVPLVLDPVLASGRGDDFAGEDLIAAMREMLFPQTTILTPNVLEARRLLGDGEDALELDENAIAQRLLQLGCVAGCLQPADRLRFRQHRLR